MQKLKQDMDYNIGENLKLLRLEAGFSQEIVAAKMQLLGCTTTRSIYSQMEIGNYSIRIMELAALKKIYGCTFEDFFLGIEIDDLEQ